MLLPDRRCRVPFLVKEWLRSVILRGGGLLCPLASLDDSKVCGNHGVAAFVYGASQYHASLLLFDCYTSEAASDSQDVQSSLR